MAAEGFAKDSKQEKVTMHGPMSWLLELAADPWNWFLLVWAFCFIAPWVIMSLHSMQDFDQP